MKKNLHDFYKVIVENMNDGYAFQKIITDDVGVAVDYEFIEVNLAFEKLTGLKREDVIGRTVSAVLPAIKKDGIDWINEYGKVATNGERVEFEGYSSSLKRWARVNAFSPAPGYFITIFHDICVIKETEEESELLHRNLIALSPDPIAILQRGQYQMVSDSFTQLFGFTVADIQEGLDFFQLVREQDRAFILKRYEERLAGAVLSKTIAVDLKTKDGVWIPCETSATLIQYKGEPAHLIIIRDITERKQAEVERQKLEEQLLQAHKMEAIGNLSGGIAHDFNNLLTVINGHTEIATNKLHRDCPLEKDLHAILQAGRRAENLTRQLLSFSRKQVVTPKVLDINESISGLEKMMRRLIGEDIGLEIVLDPSLPCIKSDAGQIEQVLVNLIVNARDALLTRTDSPQERRISIETLPVCLEEDYVASHPGMATGKHVLLKVSDNGIGMSAETKSKIFEPFFTTKEKGKGTGLGMATVYGIVKQNKGSVYVYSEPGLGTVFNIFWPATDEERRLEPINEVFVEESGGTETILLVEDDEAVRNFALETLEERGYRVLSAANGKDALQLIYARDIRIDLLFTDVVMPQMNGVELAQAVEQIFPDCKVIYSSGYTGNQIIRNGELKEGIHFVRKPYSPRDMAKKIRAVLDGVK